MSAIAIFDAYITLAEPVQQLLLNTDGTLTLLLEALNREKLSIVLLKQDIAPAETNIDALAVTIGEPLLRREVLLKGDQSGDIYVHAESHIVLERLDDRIRRGLLTTSVPLGKLWKKNRIETFKEVLDSGVEPSRELSSYFGINPETPLLVRSCRVSCGGTPVTLITEHVRCFIPKRLGNLTQGLLPFMTHHFHGAGFVQDTSPVT